jgi:hypothetical protein
MWLTRRLVPDHKTIADFRKDNGTAIRKVCAQFVAVCRAIGLLTTASVAINGSKFEAVNNRDKDFTRAKMERRLAQIEESVARYLSQLDTADLQEPSEALAVKTAHLKEKLVKLASELGRLKAIEKEMLASPDQSVLARQTGPSGPALGGSCSASALNAGSFFTQPGSAPERGNWSARGPLDGGGVRGIVTLQFLKTVDPWSSSADTTLDSDKIRTGLMIMTKRLDTGSGR